VLLDGMRHFAGTPPPAIRLLCHPPLLTDGGEGLRRGDREPGEPDALPTAETAHSIHPVVPVARADERQAVGAVREPTIERSLTVLEEGPGLIAGLEHGVEIVLFLGERPARQEGTGSSSTAASPVADT
jgi:hypothetical protein